MTRPRIARAFFAAWASLCFAFATPLAAQISAAPVIIDLDPVTAPKAAVFEVRNESSADAQFTFYTGDFDQEENGGNLFLPLGANPSSCRNRLSIAPDAATLRAGEIQRVRVQLQPGPTCWSAVFAQTAGPPDVIRGARAVAWQRIAIKVHGVAPNSRLHAEITAVSVTPKADSVAVRFTMINGGEVPLRPSGYVEIRQPNGKTLARADVEPFSALPQHRRTIETDVAARLSRGRYVAVVVLDYGGQDLIGGQSRFETR